MPVDLQDWTDERLDDVLRYLYGQHFIASGERKDDVHSAIMLILAEQSRRLALWLEGLPPVPAHGRDPRPAPLVNQDGAPGDLGRHGDDRPDRQPKSA